MSDKLRVGILGGTGMVGQRFITLLENHPWFEVVLVAASGRSAGKLYEDAVEGRWKMQTPMPEFVKKMTVYDMDKDFDEIVSKVDFVFCAVNMPKDQIKAIEERYAKAEVPVVSNNSANRWTPDVPMVVPEINPEHLEVIKYQRERLGTKRGFICVKPNCSIQSYTPALNALKEFGPKLVVATTYQAISGAGKTFEQWPEMVENIIPYIGGEEEKSEKDYGVRLRMERLFLQVIRLSHVSVSEFQFLMDIQQLYLLTLRRSQLRNRLLKSGEASREFHRNLIFQVLQSSSSSILKKMTVHRLSLM